MVATQQGYGICKLAPIDGTSRGERGSWAEECDTRDGDGRRVRRKSRRFQGKSKYCPRVSLNVRGERLYTLFAAKTWSVVKRFVCRDRSVVEPVESWPTCESLYKL